MEYNNYYPVQSGHPPPNQQHGGAPHVQQSQTSQSGGQMIHSPMQQNIRQTMPSGPPNHHQQMQQLQSQHQQQHIGHHSQQINTQPQHSNYQQIQPPHPHGPPVSHSSSPHAQQQQQQQHHHHHHHQHLNHNHNQQPNMPGPLPQQQAIPHNVHSQSPHHHGGPMHMQQHQPLSQMVRPQSGQPVMNQMQQGLHQSVHHQQNFFTGGHNMQQSNMHHYPQNPHHPNHQAQQQHHQPPVMHHAPQMSAHHPHMHQGIGRNSPYYLNILQTEFRIIELNRRLQCRPTHRQQYSPLPSPYDESVWWERFASDFFEDDATLTLRMHDDKAVEYTIGRTLIPRFFRSYFDGGVTDLSINLRNPKEACIHPQMITLDCDQASIVTSHSVKYPATSNHQSFVVHAEGHLILEFVNNSFDNLSIKSWRFYTKKSREYFDRSLLNIIGLPNNHLAEPITKHGFTKSTITYLKMCMIMEPMQELMFQHRQLKLDPRSCLRKLLFDRYKYRSGEDNRATTNKRRKRKPSAAPTVASNTTNKKSKAGINAVGNNTGINNMIMSPSNLGSGFPLASQDVMVVGEPSMMGGDFGDDNERMITRLENTQYDPTALTTTHTDESDGTNTLLNNEMNISSEEPRNLENNTMSPPMIQQFQEHPHPSHMHHQQQVTEQSPHQLNAQPIQHQMATLQHTSPQQGTASQDLIPHDDHVDHVTTQVSDQHQLSGHHEEHQLIMVSNSELPQPKSDLNEQDSVSNLLDTGNEHDLKSDQQSEEQPHVQPNGELAQDQQAVNEQLLSQKIGQDHSDGLMGVANKKLHIEPEESKINSITDATSLNNVCSEDVSENHSNSIQTDDSSQNSQLPCSTPSTKSAIEQQQPVDNGIA